MLEEPGLEPVERETRRVRGWAIAEPVAGRRPPAATAHLLALQRSAGNRAVARMLAAPLLQRTIVDHPVANPADLEKLCGVLRDHGIAISATQPSPELTELRRMIASTTDYPVAQVVERLKRLAKESESEDEDEPPSEKEYEEAYGSDGAEEAYADEDIDDAYLGGAFEDDVAPDSGGEEDEEAVVAALVQDLRAVVVWAGSALWGTRIAELKRHDIDQMLKTLGTTEAVAKELAVKIRKPEKQKGAEKQEADDLESDPIRQALEQETSHPQAVQDIIRRLGKLGITPTVYRPPDAMLLLTPKPAYASWTPLPAQQLPAPAVSQKTLLITVGHGDQQGNTQLSGQGRTGLEIATRLNLQAANGCLLYIPLQCFPNAAVRLWKQQHRQMQPQRRQPSTSIDNDEKSDDLEMQKWITDNLRGAVLEWLQDIM